MICVNGPDHAVDAQPSANMESTSIATFKGNSASPYFLGWHSLEKLNDFMSATVSSGNWRSSSVSSLLEARVSAKLKVDCQKPKRVQIRCLFQARSWFRNSLKAIKVNCSLTFCIPRHWLSSWDQSRRHYISYLALKSRL